MTIEYDQIERLEALLAERNDRIGVLEANLAEAEALIKRNAELMNGFSGQDRRAGAGSGAGRAQQRGIHE